VREFVLARPRQRACDLSVQILGKWELRLGENDGDASATCGHGAPDRIMTMVNADVSPVNPRFAVKRTLSLELENPNIVRGPDGRTGEATRARGRSVCAHAVSTRARVVARRPVDHHLRRGHGDRPGRVEG